MLVSKSTIHMISSRKWYLIGKRTITTQQQGNSLGLVIVLLLPSLNVESGIFWTVKTTAVGNVDRMLQDREAQCTQVFDEWVWELIINVRCHSNIIVILNSRNIFNATFQINVQRANGAGFFLFLYHPQVWHRRTQLYI